MANYATLKAAIQQVVKTNGNEEITGALLQQSLLAMITSLGADFMFAGIATTGTSPGTPDQNVFYLAGPGTYPNFNAAVVPTGYLGAFKYNGSWTIETVQVGKNYDAIISALQTELQNVKYGNLMDLSGNPVALSYDGVVNGIYCSVNASAFTTNSYYNVHFIHVLQDVKVSYKLSAYNSTAMAAIVVTDELPASGVAYTPITAQTAIKTGEFTVRAGQYIGCLDYGGDTGYLPRTLNGEYYVAKNIFEVVKKNDAVVDSLIGFRYADLRPTYFHGVRLVDTLTQQRFGKSTNTKIGNFVPTGATQNTVTLSAADAACIVNIVILSCKMSNGKYYDIYFSAASNNVITKLYDFGLNINCQNIVEMQSLHDTINGGAGIHLSPYGYRAMAHIIYDKLNTKQPFSDVFCGGWSAQFCLGSTGYTDPRIRDANGTVVCTPTLDGISVGGAVNRCEMTYSANVPTNGPFYRTFYGITQATPNGAKATFRIPSNYPFKGFLRVNCSSEPGYDGTIVLTVKDYDGNTVGTKNVAQFADSYIFELNDKYYNGVDVIVTMPDNVTSRVKITEMTLHETYIEDVQIRSINANSVVAMLGSSNTQFPGLATAESLCPGDPDNAIVERPDGTLGDGCGYMGKELSRVSGATVDNWGKSGEQTPYGLEIIQKVFATKHYTHIILSLFANDANANRPWADIISNIRQMVEYAKGQGCVPIVIMGYPSNGTGTATSYALMYEDLTQGMDSPFIYTSAQMH